MHSCERCGYETNRLSNLKKHLQRKIPCEAKQGDVAPSILLNKLHSNENIPKKVHCNKCGKEYADYCGLLFHQKRGCQQENIQNTLQNTIRNIVQSEIEKFKGTVVNANHYGDNIINFNLNNYGNENLSYLTTDFLDDCVKRLNNGMKNLVQHIHFNPQVPENRNIRVLSKKQNLLETFRDGAWHPCDKNNTLDEMIKKGYRILFQHFLNTTLDSEGISDQISKYFVNLMNRETEEYFQLRRDLYVMILDNTLYVLSL